MKLPKIRYDYLLFLYLPLTLLGIGLSIFFPKETTITLQIIMLVLLGLALLLALSPYGKQRLDKNTSLTAYTTWRWLGSLWGLQLGSYLMFWTITQGILITLPVPDNLWEIDKQDAIQSTLHFFTQAGLYPWPISLLLGISLASLEGSFFIRQTLRPFFRKVLDGIWGTGVDLYIRQGLYLACAMTIAIAVLQLVQILSSLIGAPLELGMHTSTLFLSIIIFLLLNSKLWQRYMRYLWVQHYPLSIWFLVHFLVIIFTITIFNLVIKLIGTYLPIQMPLTIQIFSMRPQTWLQYWQLFCFIWWFFWVPLMASFIARLAKAHTSRVIIFAGLIFPTALAGTEWTLHHFAVNHLTQLIMEFMQNKYFTLLAAIVSLGLLSRFFKDPEAIGLVNFNKPTAKTKRYPSLTSLHNLSRLIASTITVYLLLGIPLITLLSSSIALPLVLFICVACLFAPYRLFMKQ